MEPNNNSLSYKVVDYSAALQITQGLESRDFSYKGIHKLFMVVGDWTEKYPVNKALPNEDQLMREVGLEREQIEHFIYELCFKHTPPLMRKMITIEYDPNNKVKSEIVSNIVYKNTVFARPTNLDAGSALRYVVGCNDNSAISIEKAIKNNRVPLTGEKFRDFIVSRINANRLHETYASQDIANLFHCPYDTKKELKEATLEMHLRPLLKKLADNKLLIFFRNDKASGIANQQIYLYNTRDEIIERIEIYTNYMKSHIIPGLQKLGVIGQITEEEYKDFANLANKALHVVDNSYGDQKTLLEELVILGNYYENYKEEVAKQQLKGKIDEIIKLLLNANKLVDVANIRINGEPLAKEMIPNIIAHESILYTEYDDKRNYYEFILHKSCIKKAIENAKKEYKVSGNDVYIRILERMGVFEHADSESKKEFSQIEIESLFKYLPFLTRLWRTILGNIYVTQEEAVLIRRQQLEEQKKRIIGSKMKIIQKEKTRIAEERLKQDKEIEDSSKKYREASLASNPELEPSPDEPNTSSSKQNALMTEDEARELLKAIVKILDTAWDVMYLPNREYLLQELQSALTEEQLVLFLKKYAYKEVLSFQIKTKVETNRYKWPILISKGYIKRKGKALLEIARRETDEQRKAKIPNQEKYDVFISIEDFLGRVMKPQQ